MREATTKAVGRQAVAWEGLEGWVREQVQQLIQELLEAEVTELLGRSKSQRREAVDARPGYRNGHGEARQLTLGSGTVRVQRPRVRGLEERFASRVLPLFARRSQEVSDLLPELYLHGLAEGDFDLALRGLLGEDAPLSASTVARLKQRWQGELAAWQTRPLEGLEVVYLWVDGVYVKAGLEDRKAALLVALAGLSDGRKVVLALQAGARESIESWGRLLRDLQARGLRPPRLVIGDGHLGIWGALRGIYPEAQEQRCWNHRIVNVLDRIGRRDQPAARELLRQTAYAPTLAAAERNKRAFQAWCGQRGYPEAGRLLDQDWERMVTFYRFPQEHWGHLRTTNPVESPFAALRLRTVAAKRFKKVENATAVIWKLLLLAERRFRRLNAPELLADVWHGAQFVDGVRVPDYPQEAAA
jgi:transposase-like protein